MATFLLLGGTGKVGRRLAQSLTQAGHQPRAASRHAVIPFDWADPATWPAALAGADGLFIVGPGSATDWSPRLTRLLAAAAAARSQARGPAVGPRRGVPPPTAPSPGAEQGAARRPLPWTILRPAHFAQNFTEAMFVPQDGVIRAGRRHRARAVHRRRRHRRGGIGRAGRRRLSRDRARPVRPGGGQLPPRPPAILADVSGKPVRFEDETDEAHVARLRAAGTPEGYVRWRMAMLGGIRRGADAYLSDGVQQVLGREPASLREWAEREVVPW